MDGVKSHPSDAKAALGAKSGSRKETSDKQTKVQAVVGPARGGARPKQRKANDSSRSTKEKSCAIKPLDATSGSRRETSDKQTKVQAVVGPAHGGARPKQRKANDSSRSTKEKNCAIKQHKDVGRNNNDKGFSERRSSSTPRCPIDMTPKPVAENTLHKNRNDFHSTGIFQDANTSRSFDGFQEPKGRKTSKNKRQLMRCYPKEVNSKVPFQLCRQFSNGGKCQKSHCTFAHGEEELTFWTSERQSDLESFGRIAYPKVPQHDNEFDNIYGPKERIQGSSTMSDTRRKTPRPPPTGVYHGNFQLCKWWKSGRVCRYGRGCTFAHGNDELRSWRENKKENQEIRSEEESSYQKPEKNADISRSEMVYSLPGVEVSSNKPTAVKIFIQGDKTRHYTFDWVFTVTFEISEVGKLFQIDLLHQYHDCYRLTEVKGFFNNIEAFSRVPTERWSYRIPDVIDAKEGQIKVVVSLSFETTKFNQTFTQCLRFDFGKKPYLLQGLNVDVASEEALNRISATRQQLKLDPSVWTESLDIVPSPETAAMCRQDLLLLEKYKLPERIENVVSAQIIDGKLTVGNYEIVMHQLLLTEELFMKKAISSFVLQNVPLHCQKSIISERTGMIIAANGEMFGILRFQENESLQPDDAAGRLLIRNVQSAWLKLPVAGSSSQKVYEAYVQKVESECVMLKLSSQMCLDLQLIDTGDISLDVQFQLNRQPFCQWHAAIDRLGPSQVSSLLFPKQNSSQVNQKETRPWNWLPLDPKLDNNDNQREVIRRILSPGNNSSPLVVFGPFGTGKTFTLNQAIRHLVTKERNRILLCTHTNSAADIHVKLLHDYLTKENGLKATRPLRIYQTKRRLVADSEIAKTYGLIANNAYVLPTREDVIRHRVVITTLAMSKHLLKLQLNHGFFTHILVDEAAQALEPEALIPLALAGPNTKVVFTGDHMQMSPEVYSHHARDWGLQRSLPERLFDHLYREEQPLDCKVMFLTENYRCHPEILQFPSDNFYNSGLIASGEQVSHPRLGALLFYSVHGVEEAIENSYINTEEVYEVVKRVKELAYDWPVEWKEKDLSQIGVISAYMTQVRAIRTYLRKESRDLQNVTVESIHNVQGKEFRALFISTVRTSLTCRRFDRREGESQSPYWEFLSDPKLLNTAITRAKSLVAVVGDGLSLCAVGDCRGNWLDYIRRCHKHGTLHGTSYGDIMKEMDTLLAKISLNPESDVFVPKSIEVDDKEFQSLECATQPDKLQDEISGFEVKSEWEVCNNAKSSVSSIANRDNNPTEENVSGIEMDCGKDYLTQEELTSEDEEQEKYEDEDEDEKEEQQKTTQSSPKNDGISVRMSPQDIALQHQGDFASYEEIQCMNKSEEEADVEQNTLHFLEEFRRETFEDETVFPRYFDKIIQALVEKCKEAKEKERRPRGSSESAISTPKMSNKEKRSSPQEKSRFSDLPSDDYQIDYVNGRLKAHLVNVGFHQMPSDRHERLVVPSRQHHDGFLESELLQQKMLEKPKKYLSCTLRLDSEILRTGYAVISDTKTPDIKIKGRIRGVFDMDHVVVEKVDSQPPSSDGVPRSNGKIVGVLHHIISPHERQFVCRVDYENPEVMLPINKSVSKIVILSAKGVRGVPLYREKRDGNEDVVKVENMDFAEVRSGKYMFLVQYLQWRSDCSHPLGIIVRKLPQRYTLNDGMEILFAEHGIKKSFDEECRRQVRAKFPPDWSIPAEENQSRQKIDGAFTIDPENSKDLDDALTLEQLPGSVYRVGVHIADVSYFVEAGTQLDKEALYRCTSYYPGHGCQNVPMLPRELSENHCSLLPGKDSLCLSVFLDMSEEGKLVGQPNISRTIVRSSCQLTYSDAQKLIDGLESSLPKDAGEKIKDMSALAQRRRKLRLGDAGCDHWSNSDDPKHFEAHELVEEMMILANEEIAKFLSMQLPDIAPLRTQLPPKDHKLSDWVRQYGQFIKHSLFLRGFYSEEILRNMTKDVRSSEDAEFKVQDSVWSELCNAAESGDEAKLNELICNESNHPQLAVANSQFRRIQPKSQYVCKKDQPKENAAHFSLGMSCYTHFTSPIRHYIDIQVHRLVLDLISQGRSANRPSNDQVAKVCRRSTFAQDNSRKFDKACKKVHLAAKLKEKSHETTAVIAMIENEGLSLEIPNQEYNHLSARQTRVKLSTLNLFTFDVGQNGSEIVLTWRLRLYIAPKENITEEAKKEREKVVALLSEGLVGKGEVLNLPGESWQQILKALQEGKYEDLTRLIRMTETCRQLHPRLTGSSSHSKPSNDSKPDANMEHFYEKKMSLRTFDIVNVQLTAHMTNGVFHPEIQLFKINPSVHICVEHRKYPRDCFATTSRYQASRKKYKSVDNYIDAWKPVLAMEAVTGAVNESDEFTIHDLKVQWIKEISGKLEGSFSLQKEYCKSRQIEFYAGDFVCVHVREDRFMKKTLSETAATESNISQVEVNPLNKEELNVTQLAAPSCLANNSRHESRSALPSFWVGHCVIKHVRTESVTNMDTSVVTMDLHQSASVFPEELLNGSGHLSTLSVIHRSLPHRRMFAALCRDLQCASQLVHSICMGHEPDQEDFGAPPSSNLSIMCGFKPLNQYQEEAVKEALVKPFTLVLGPPGTGKTVTGVHIAYWFAKRNNQMQPQKDQEPLDSLDPNNADKFKAPPQVIYCGPSNKSVDVVAKYMLQIPELKIIRVYGDLREQAEFPIPNKRKHLKSSTDDEVEELKAVSLHHVIRRDPCPFASMIQEYDSTFTADKKKHVRTSDKEVEDYRKLIGRAEEWVLQSSGAQIILCTCAVAGSPRIMKSCDNIQQCIVDECGMCLEPETLVPITCSGARQVVLIGDHKQLQPVIQDHVAKTLGLSVSMFERHSKRAKMLELQYRMQKDICKFPSDYFYERKLKTDPSVLTRDPRLKSFWPTNVPMAFCHVEGKEESSAIKTAQSNEQSKANMKEVGKVVHVARCLVHKNGVRASDVVILSPYREQRSRISAALQRVFRCKDIPVTTIAKSQGSEWDYVILSLVRSMRKDELDPEPSLHWLREHLGFLTDEHQMNVGLTRARKGLCIIGNKNLLIHHPMWQSLIEFYEKKHCLVDESVWPRN